MAFLCTVRALEGKESVIARGRVGEHGSNLLLEMFTIPIKCYILYMYVCVCVCVCVHSILIHFRQALDHNPGAVTFFKNAKRKVYAQQQRHSVAS